MLLVNACCLLALGSVCVVCGIVSRSANVDICRMFESGELSIETIRAKAAVRTEADLVTEKERILFAATMRAHQHCIGLSRILVGFSTALLTGGTVLLLFGGTTAWCAIGLRKAIGEQRSLG